MSADFSHYGTPDEPVTPVHAGGVMVSVGTLGTDEVVVYLGISEHFPVTERMPAALLTARQVAWLIGDLANALDCLLDQETR
jgi:hypothetical protein